MPEGSKEPVCSVPARAYPESPCGVAPDRAWPLYGAALMMAVSLSMAWTAMPFVLSWMGGTSAHVGYAPAINNFAYLIALLVTGPRFGHLSARRTTLCAATVALLATAAMSLMVLGVELGPEVHSAVWIWALIIAGGIGGAALAFYWPFLMSWVSADYEGVQLNRRFGRYNGAWSSGGTIGPLIGGWLFEVNPVLPLAMAVTSVLLALLLLRWGRDGAAHKTGVSTPTAIKEAIYDVRLLSDCRWVSRISLLSVCVCFAIVRSQFALVFRDFGYAESQFGAYLTIYALCNFATLVAAGRWALWHFKPSLLIVGQAVLLLTLLMTIYGKTLSTFFASAVLLGLAYGFAYTSHLYYGASASRQRSARMAIHEIVISTGLTVGSLSGGYLAQHVGLYAPYWFAIVLVGLGMAGQMALHLTAEARMARHKRVPAATGTEMAE